MSEEQDEKDRGFKIDDRRRFTSQGEARSDASGETKSGKAQKADEPLGGTRERSDAGGALEGLSFSSFVIGLASQAFVFLGAVPDQGGGVRKDLPQAKAMIDILSMLSAKTAGNLDEHEARMMEEMLYELRIQYVRELRGAGSEGGKS
jgi:hypothetical protein